jgi:hypothetical protein
MSAAEFQRAPVFFARVQCPICDREHEWFAKEAWVCDSRRTLNPALGDS